jgi:hypothetical protein
MYKHYIFVNSFYGGFKEKTDANHMGYFETLFKKTKLRNIKVTDDIDQANILFESCFGNSINNYKEWSKKIYFSGESWLIDTSQYDIILKSSYTNDKTVDLPLFVVYVLNNPGFYERLIERPLKTKETIPPKFCCFCVSNGECFVRNKMFEIISSYKKVDSFGNHNNNVGYNITSPYWSEEYFNHLKQYKFIICMENLKSDTYNTYITEKLVNAYFANSVPIYWGTPHVNNIFQQFLYLENENDILSYMDVLEKVKELDQNDETYLEFINKPVFNKDFFDKNYSFDAVANKINQLL